MKKMYVFIVAVMFAAVLSFAGKVYAFSPYYNNYYVSLNGGIADTSPSGLSSTSGGTYNLTLGKNYNFNNIVIGAGALLGYADNGSYTYNNYDGYGDNVKESLSSAYYGVFVKGGYAFNNIMPFVKLGYIGYSFNDSTSYSGPYGNYYGGYSSSIGSESGLLYGAGIEYMINPSWGVTAQYFGAALSGSDKINNFTVGIDFNF
jgi:hypothetical protein